MRRIKVLACETLRDEIQYCLEENALDYDITWIESGLHNFPEKLHDVVQQDIDRITDCDQLLLIMGRCGNAINHVKAGNFQVIIPKVDDCISLLFGSDSDRQEYSQRNSAYFLTEGWMRGERNIWVEYQYTAAKYDREMAQEISQMMYGHYKVLALLDTGIKEMDDLYQETEKIEKELHLKRTIVPATLAYLSALLKGPWTESKFYILEPHEELIL